MSRPTVPDLVLRTASPRMILPYGTSAIAAAFLHCGFLAIFAWRGVWPLVYFNVFSIALFAFTWWLGVKKGRIPLALTIALVEVVVHQVVAVHHVGLDAGFQFYLLAVGPLPLLLPEAPKWVRFGSPVALLAGFGAIYAVFSGVPHPYSLGYEEELFVSFANLLASFLILWAFAYFYQHGADLAEGALVESRARSERLLHNILPPRIVDRLRARPGVVADAIGGASILFTDLVGFTPLSQSKSAEEVVMLLDRIVGTFDDLVVERGLEKIKTIGDAYMVAAGVPDERADHAEAIAELALAMREKFEEISASAGVKLAMRCGICSGPVVAGVIGKSKFAYDLWGDTVNTAARMESYGEPGKIHVSEATVKALGDGWIVEERGMIDVKGKGVMRTYWLVGRAARSAKVA